MEKLTLFSTNMDNLTEQEQKQLMALVNKGKKPLKKRWKAGVNGGYFFVSGIGEITYLIEKNSSFDKKAYELGNYFVTKEEAEFEVNKRLVLQQLKDYALSHNRVELDWKNSSQLKWVIFYDAQSKCLDYDYWYTHYYIGQIYFSSPKVAHEAVKTVGEARIKKYLFGVN